MIEDKASDKWCPFVRAPEGEVGSGIAVNRYIDRGGVLTGGKAVTCIASGCMAWRWFKYRGKSIFSDGPHRPNKSKGGYCGLAGKP